ncbi:MAG TPA: hypothetical protein VFH99_02205 [Candidatus Saccharimonadales bacterium]|nr:hypothetical protein [Candidatus Saccharimonadales bacterium]
MAGERAPNDEDKPSLRERPIGEVASVLQEILGQRLSAYAIGEPDPRRIGVFARDHETPGEEAEESLRDLAEVVDALTDQEVDPETIRAWMIGDNPLLDNAPIQAFHTGSHQEIVNAAECIGRT